MTTTAEPQPDDELAEYIEHFRARVLQDALAQATAVYWRNRAADFDNARPRPGDHNGPTTPADLADADRRCTETAQACRNAARLALLGGDL